MLFKKQNYRCLLGKYFQFIVDHHTLLHLLYPIITGCILCWTVLLMEFAFEVAFKSAKMHYVPDLSSRVIKVAKHASSIATLDGHAKLQHISSIPMHLSYNGV